MRLRLYLPSEGRCAADFIALPSPRPGLNPRTLGPMASTLTIASPRWRMQKWKKIDLCTNIGKQNKLHVCWKNNGNVVATKQVRESHRNSCEVTLKRLCTSTERRNNDCNIKLQPHWRIVSDIFNASVISYWCHAVPVLVAIYVAGTDGAVERRALGMSVTWDSPHLWIHRCAM
jgi:hypothetical protein